MQNVIAFGMPGPMEWIIILIIAVLLFGKRLPEIARGMGKSLTEFKKGVKEAEHEVTRPVDDDIVSPEDTMDQEDESEPGEPEDQAI